MEDQRFISDRFPRSSRYHPEWILAGFSGGANPLWLTEWLCEALTLQPGMRVLDLGCGRALSSIFLHREYDVQVWAADFWFSPSENIQRIQDAKVDHAVFPIRADARSLPFPDEFFDVVIGIDSFMYFGTDDLYLNYLARFLKPEGQLGIAMAGFAQELPSPVPAHMAEWWVAEKPYCLHSAAWWRQHWERTGIVAVETFDTMPDGWHYWREWLKIVAPANTMELTALEVDAGRNFAYTRTIARRQPQATLFDPAMSLPVEYRQTPLLRENY
jgi:ubiquinone/menaquinone biosynthesis C-methylase UbiE